MGYLQRFSYSNIESAKDYIAAVNEGRFPIAKLSESTDKEMMRKVMTKLYLRLPVDKQEFKERFGKLPEEVYPEQLKRLKEGFNRNRRKRNQANPAWRPLESEHRMGIRRKQIIIFLPIFRATV